jgi:hypothetical protein
LTQAVTVSTRDYASSAVRCEAAASAEAANRQTAQAYNEQRAAYNRQVARLRRSYLEEYKRNRRQDMEERDLQRAADTRARLERQRLKNERSVLNAQRQEELRRQAHASFQDRLRQQQEIRDRKKELKQRAQRLLLQELEEEAPLWLTTPQEVDAAFDSLHRQQQLWARPQGVLGVPNPSLDSHFWNHYQGHTWDMAKTYKTQSQLLMEDLQQEAYHQTNIDTTVWNDERVQQQERLEQKAKLRALVRNEGRKSLLKKQQDFLQHDYEASGNDIDMPKPMPVPALGILANVKAQEREGARLLLQDPTRFFVFAQNNDTTTAAAAAAADASGEDDYTGSSLGTPVAVRDPLRTGQPQGRVFPQGVGKLPKPDTRTEKEKKRQEREERLLAAAAQAQAGKTQDDLELIPEEDREIGTAIDYDANDGWDSDDEEWEKGLDKDLDAAVMNVPREFRYREQDLDAVIVALEQKAKSLRSHVQNTIQTMEQEARSRMDRTESAAASEAGDEAGGVASRSDSEPFFDAATAEKLAGVGANVDKYEQLMSSLTQDQLLSLFGLEAKQRSAEAVPAVEGEELVSAAETGTSIFESIEGLSKEQVAGLTELESFMRVLEQSDDSNNT